MPAHKGSKKLVHKQSLLGHFQSNKKVIKDMEAKTDSQLKEIDSLQKKHKTNDTTLKQLDCELQSQQIILCSKINQINKLREEIEHTKNKTKILQIERCQKYRITLTNRAVKRRLNNPSSDDLNFKTKCVCRSETYQMCQAVHGGTDANSNPTLYGMLDTVASKFKSSEVSSAILSSKKSVVNSLKDTQLGNWAKSYKNSNQNVLRSMNVFYSHDVMGKRKYINVLILSYTKDYGMI